MMEDFRKALLPKGKDVVSLHSPEEIAKINAFPS